MMRTLFLNATAYALPGDHSANLRMRQQAIQPFPLSVSTITLWKMTKMSSSITPNCYSVIRPMLPTRWRIRNHPIGGVTAASTTTTVVGEAVGAVGEAVDDIDVGIIGMLQQRGMWMLEKLMTIEMTQQHLK